MEQIEFYQKYGYMFDREQRLREVGDWRENSLAIEAANQIKHLKEQVAEIESLRQQLADQQLISREANDYLIDANLALAELEQQLAEARAWRVPAPGFDEQGLQFAKEIRHMIQTEDAIGWRREHDQFILDAIEFYTSPTPQPPAGGVVLDKPLSVFSEGEWIYKGTGQSFSAVELNEAAFVVYRAILAQPQQEVGHD